MPCLVVEFEDGSEKEILVNSETLKAMYQFMQGWLATANLSRVHQMTGISRQTLMSLRDNEVNVGIDKLGQIFDAYHKLQDQ